MRQERKKLNDDETLLRLHSEGKTYAEIGAHFQCSAPAVHKRLRKLLLPRQVDQILEASGLTPQQQKFALAKASGMSNTMAAANAYETSTRDSARNIACQNMANPTIRQVIDELCQIHGLTRAYKVGKLKEICDNRNPDTALSGLRVAFQLTDDMPPAKSVNLHADITPGLSDAVRELSERIINRQGPVERVRVIDVSEGDGR